MFIGYRTFKQRPDGLHSLNETALWVTPFLKATCAAAPLTGKRHSQRATPHEDCTCGIYAKKTIASLLQEYTLSGPLAEVALSGKIVEGTDGYRAEKAEILAFFIPPCQLCGQPNGRYNIHTPTNVSFFCCEECWPNIKHLLRIANEKVLKKMQRTLEEDQFIADGNAWWNKNLNSSFHVLRVLDFKHGCAHLPEVPVRYDVPLEVWGRKRMTVTTSLRDGVVVRTLRTTTEEPETGKWKTSTNGYYAWNIPFLRPTFRAMLLKLDQRMKAVLSEEVTVEERHAALLYWYGRSRYGFETYVVSPTRMAERLKKKATAHLWVKTLADRLMSPKTEKLWRSRYFPSYKGVWERLVLNQEEA